MRGITRMGFVWAAALCVLGAEFAPVAAQSLNWDNGSDLLGQFDVRRRVSAPMVAPAPTAAGRLLVVDAVDTVMGNFHRYDNRRHPYGAGHYWADFIGSGYGPDSAFARQDADGAVTIEFSDLEDLLRALVKVAAKEHAQVAVLNISSHGHPGGSWFPPDEEAMNGSACQAWMQTAESPDAVSYGLYYSDLYEGDIKSMRRLSARANPYFDCATGADDWRRVASRIKGIDSIFAPGAQIHFDSCLTGLGKAGERFVKAVAEALFPHGGGNVVAAMDYGLTDWSMPKGMGFWDYQSDAQLARFDKLYPKDRKDSEFAQMGSVRVASYENGTWTTFVVGGLSVMPTGAAPFFSPAANVALR